MKRDSLRELGLNDEQMDFVFAEHGKTITDLKARLTTVEGERDQYRNERDTQKAELEKTYTDKQKDFAIQYAMKSMNTQDNNLVMGLLDRDKISIVDGELNGLTEQLDNIKQEKSFLFKEEEQAKPTPQIVVGGNPSNPNYGEKDAFSSITEKYR